MISRLVLGLSLSVSSAAFADGESVDLLNTCSANKLRIVSTVKKWIEMNNSSVVMKEAKFEVRKHILADKVMCVYNRFVADAGGMMASLSEAVKNGKFKQAGDALRIVKADIMKNGLNGDDLQRADTQFTIDAINEVLLPSAIPASALNGTLGQLSEGHVGLIKASKSK